MNVVALPRPVRQGGDGRTHQPLGVVLRGFPRRLHRLRARTARAGRRSAPPRSARPRSGPPCRRPRGPTRGYCRGGAATRARSSASCLVDLDRLELEPLRVGVDGVDDAAAPGGEGADVEVVGGGHREADEALPVERGDDEGDVRPVARARVGVVVHDDVARPDRVPALGELAKHTLHVARNGPGLERGRLRGLGEPLPVRVHQPGPEVLRFADDGRVGHPHELVAHLRRDVLERALDDTDGDRVHRAVGAAGAAVPATGPVSAGTVPGAAGAACAAGLRRALAHGDSSMVMMRLPASSARAVLPGGMTVVESRCSTTAGPGNDSPTGRRSRR